eukprot:Skav230748  [mRNA]  locus=scaffold3436:129906:131021:+ [translate_table: standard]
MGRRSKSREISKERLGHFSDDESTFYRKYFKKLGGKGCEFIERSQVKRFLQRSELSDEIIEEILKIATAATAAEFVTLDLEAFCVACRLVAHAQDGSLRSLQLGDLVAQVPSNAPWFSEEPEPQTSKVEAALAPLESSEAQDFDFEAVALGFSEEFSGQPTAAPEVFADMGQGGGGRDLETFGRAELPRRADWLRN